MSFTIKDLQNLTGIKAHTLRIWGQRYSFLKPLRSTTNIRYYSDDELKVLLNVSLLNKYGYKISKIDLMSEMEIKEKICSLSELALEDRLSNEMIKAMIECDIKSFDHMLQNHIDAFGIKKSVTKVIYPFLDRIGILWQTENINPAQEHLVSNIIRQKIIVAIDKLGWPGKCSKKVCLFLPEGEYHELTLLFISYLFKKQGLESFYIGSNTPLKDVFEIAFVTKPDFLYTHITTAGRNFNFDRFIKQLSEKFKGTEIYISGTLSRIYEKKIPSTIHFKRSLPEVLKFIESL